MLLYIDPGTGSMLFTILIGVIGAAFYSLRMLFIKLRYKFSGEKTDKYVSTIPIVIFAESKRYSPIFSPICRELDDKGVNVLYITSSPDDPIFNCKYKNITAECIENQNKLFSRLNFINATIVLSTTPGLDVYQWKRSKYVQYYVHIPHAPSEIIMYRMFGIDYYDAILLSGDYQIKDIQDLEKSRNIAPKELLKVGIPYMDEMVKRLNASTETPEHPRTVLLAPSWGPSAIFSVYGEKILDKLLKTGYHIIVRPHPQSFDSEKELMEKLMKKYPESEQLEWNRDMDNFEVLKRSDILISDFSGVIFDFSLVYDKPIIYTDPKFDVGVYDAWWLNRPLWTISALPRLGKELTNESMENIKELIDSCLSDEHFSAGRAEVKNETWEYQGEGAKRAAEYLLNKYKTLTKSKEEQK